METKECVKCRKVLSAEQFYRRKDTGGLTGECKPCKVARSRRYYEDNTAAHARVVKRRYDTHGRFARYGLSRDDYDAALERQGHCCALCGKEHPGGKGKWHIDHAHVGPKKSTFHQAEAHQFRGLLCHRCNIALGHFEQLVSRIGLDAVLKYLERGFVR